MELIVCPKCNGRGEYIPQEFWATTGNREPVHRDCPVCLGAGRADPEIINRGILLLIENNTLQLVHNISHLNLVLQNVFHELVSIGSKKK